MKPSRAAQQLSNDDPSRLVSSDNARFGYIPFSREKAKRILTKALAEDRRHLIVVAEVRGRVEGFVFASVGEYHVGTGVLIATINAIYTSAALRGSFLSGRAAVGLFRAVGLWSKGVGAHEILLHATSGIGVERVGKTVGRIGFKAVGQTYSARVE